MPEYSFECLKCHKRFSKTLPMTEYEKRAAKVKCPRCQAVKPRRCFEAFVAVTAKKS